MKIDIEKIRERVEKATPGPWDNRCKEFSNTEKPRHILANYGWVATVGSPLNSTIADAEFIAHSRQDIPDLLNALEIADAKLAIALEAIKKVHDDEETGEGWGPDVTMKAVLANALQKIEALK